MVKMEPSQKAMLYVNLCLNPHMRPQALSSRRKNEITDTSGPSGFSSGGGLGSSGIRGETQSSGGRSVWTRCSFVSERATGGGSAIWLGLWRTSRLSRLGRDPVIDPEFSGRIVCPALEGHGISQEVWG